MCTSLTHEALDALARSFRQSLVDSICAVQWGHLGGTMSLVEIMITLYHRVLRIDPANLQWPDRDRLVLSKGHAGPVLYVALASRGVFPKEDLAKINIDGTCLPSHCDMRLTPGVDFTSGSLGQGLSAACGLATSAKMDGKSHRIFCIIGDGESDEGQIWEAAMFAGNHRLDNLVVICDYSHWQIDGSTDEICCLEPLADKWRAFNWEVLEMDGHDWDAIYTTLQAAIAVTGKPTLIIAHTIKGKGHRDYENTPESHSIRVVDEKRAQRLRDGLMDVPVKAQVQS